MKLFGSTSSSGEGVISRQSEAVVSASDRFTRIERSVANDARLLAKLADAMVAPSTQVKTLIRDLNRQQINPFPLLRAQLQACRREINLSAGLENNATEGAALKAQSVDLSVDEILKGDAPSVPQKVILDVKETSSLQDKKIQQIRQFGRVVFKVNSCRNSPNTVESGFFEGRNKQIKQAQRVVVAFKKAEQGFNVIENRRWAQEVVWRMVQEQDYRGLQACFDKGLNPNYCLDLEQKKLTLLEAAFQSRDLDLAEFLLINGATLDKVTGQRLLRTVMVDVQDRDYKLTDLFSQNDRHSRASLAEFVALLDGYGVLPKISEYSDYLINGLIKSVINDADSVSDALSDLDDLATYGLAKLFKTTEPILDQQNIKNFIRSSVAQLSSSIARSKKGIAEKKSEFSDLMRYTQSTIDIHCNTTVGVNQSAGESISLLQTISDLLIDVHSTLGDDGLVQAAEIFDQQNSVGDLIDILRHSGDNAFAYKMLLVLKQINSAGALGHFAVPTNFLPKLIADPQPERFLSSLYPLLKPFFTKLSPNQAFSDFSNLGAVKDIHWKLLHLASWASADQRISVLNSNDSLKESFLSDDFKSFRAKSEAYLYCTGQDAPLAPFFDQLPDASKILNRDQADFVLSVIEHDFTDYLVASAQAPELYQQGNYTALAQCARQHNIDRALATVAVSYEADIEGILDDVNAKRLSPEAACDVISSKGLNNVFTRAPCVKALNTNLQLAEDVQFAGMIGGYNTSGMWDYDPPYFITEQPVLLYRGMAVTPDLAQKWATPGRYVSLNSAFTAISRNTAESYARPNSEGPDAVSVVLEIFVPRGCAMLANISGEYVLDSSMLASQVREEGGQIIISGFMMR